MIDLKDWTDDVKNNPKGIKFKNIADRRKFVMDKLGLKTVKHPKTGKECVPVAEKLLMLTGHRRSAVRSKEQEFTDKDEIKEEFEKASSSLKVDTNSRVTWLQAIF